MDEPASRHHRVRHSYDAVAGQYATGFRDELLGKPLDRALLACLAGQADDGAPVADLWCGPGHVAAWLAACGVATVGIDLSPAMIAIGRRDYPQVEFREGDLLELPAADGELAAVVAFYSIIHLDPGELPRAFEEMHRALRPRAHSLVAIGPHRTPSSSPRLSASSRQPGRQCPRQPGLRSTVRSGRRRHPRRPGVVCT